MARLASFFRLIRADWVLVREGVIAALPGENSEGLVRTAWQVSRLLARRNVAATRTDRIARAVARLGPSYVKLGQFLATRADVIGPQMARDLSGLLDKMDGFPIAASRRAIEDSLGRSADDLFAEIGEAVAAASIAQVHPGRVALPDGTHRRVAIKVIRPGVREDFRKNNDVFLLAAQLQERFLASSARLRPVEVARTLEQSTRIEMDLRLVAAALSELAENSAHDPKFRVPAVDWDRTGRDVLTMEWIDGVKLSDLEALKASGIDLEALAVTVIQTFLRHALRDGFFHADMHPGNLFVEPDGTLVALDLGISGRIGKKERRFLAEILYGFIVRDYQRVAQVHFDAGYVPAHHSVAAFAQAIRAIGEPIHGQPAETISMARLLTLLFEITEIFDMETRTELLLLQKTMVVAEGVSRMLDPKFNMWVAAKPVIEDWIAGNLGPRAVVADLGEGLSAAVTLARKMPEIAARTERLAEEIETMTEQGLRFDAETARAIGKAEARAARSGRIALWVIAVTLIVIAVRLW